MARTLLFLLSLSFLMGNVPAKSTREVAFVADDWCPQHCEDDSINKGYIVDLVSAAYLSEGVKVSISYLPWLRALFEVKKGSYDGLLTPTVKGYPQFHYHQEPVGYQEYCVYTRKDDTWKYQKEEDFLDKRVAYLKDSGLGSVEQYMQKNKTRIESFEFVGTSGFTRKIFDFLEDKRTDAIIISSDVYHYSLKTRLINDVFRDAGCLGREKLAVGFSKVHKERSKDLARVLDKGIKNLRESGELKKILDRYGMEDWKP